MTEEEVQGSWHWYVRETLRKDIAWYFNSLPGPIASWISPENLAEQKRLSTNNDYTRLWLNVWLMDTGEVLSMALVDACVTFKRNPLDPVAHLRGLEAMVCGLDLSQTQDHSAFVAIGIDIHKRKLRLCESKRWKPKDFPENKNRINLEVVEKWCVDYMSSVRPIIGLVGIAFDPHQCERSAIEFANQGFITMRQDFTAKEQSIMADTLLSVFRDQEIDLYRDDNLFFDLPRIVIESHHLGHKIKAFKSENGHCDTAVAFSIALPWAKGTMIDLLAS